MRKRTQLYLSSSSSSSSSSWTEDLVEERDEHMVFPSENSRPSSKKNHFVKPCFTTSIDGSEAMLPDLKALSFSVLFNGWRLANTNFKSWTTKMAALHEPTWRKAGIFEAVMASTYRIHKETDLLLGMAEKWCPGTNTFVFPWGETTITLEDVMVLLGFSVLGSPVFATLDSSGEKIKAKLKKEWQKIKEDKIFSFVTQVAWMRRFMDSDDELEHVAFLALWLSYFVFPSRYYHLPVNILPIAVHLSTGTRIALAPAVLAHLYAELSLLKNHIRAFRKPTVTDKADLTALFKLVQLWTWERFRELQPKKPNPLLKGKPRLSLWHDLKQRTSDDARQILDNSKIDSFEWRPYTKTVKNWEFPKFYPEKAMWVPVGPSLDDEFFSFARCIKVSELVGIDCLEDYFPNRVASQFGMLQDVPCPVIRNNLSQEAAWNDYNKPLDDLTLYIPSRSATSRVTPMFCGLWRKSFPEFQNYSKEKDVVESAETSKARNIIGDDTSFVPSGSKMSRTSGVGIKIAEDSTKKRRKCVKLARDKRRKCMKRVREDDDNSFVPSGSKMSRTSEDGMKIARDPTKKIWQYMKRARDKRYKYMKQARDKIRNYMKRVCENDESTMGRCQTQVPSDNDEEDDNLTIAQILKKYSDVKNSGVDPSEPLGKKSRVEADSNDSGPCQKLASIRAHGDETVPPPEIEKRNEETVNIGSKAGNNMVLSPIYENNSSDPPLGANGGAIDILVSPQETRQTCDDEIDVCGSNVEKMTMIDDGREEPECLLHEDGAMAGEKASSDEKENDVVDYDTLIQKKPALNADRNEPFPRQKLASGGPNGDDTSDESNIHIVVGDGTQGNDCLLHDTALGSEETVKSNEKLENLEKENEDVGEGGVGNDSYEKSLHNVKVLASSIEERIIKAQRNVAWLKERRAIKQRKIAAARLI